MISSSRYGVMRCTMQANRRLYLTNHRHRTITRPFSGLLWQQIDQLSKSEQKNTLTYSMKKENVVCTSTQRRRLNGFVNDRRNYLESVKSESDRCEVPDDRTVESGCRFLKEFTFPWTLHRTFQVRDNNVSSR
jgi:hypothetical protein